jgi:hypothetical protein
MKTQGTQIAMEPVHHKRPAGSAGGQVFRKLRVCLAVCALLPGCTSLGPTTIVADRFDYSAAIADSWKQQTLLNIVKLRYLDLPVFVDVASVVSGYSLQTGVSVNGTLSTERAVQGNFLAAGVQGVYTDRPTITYTPATGQKFLRGLLEPIDPKNIFFMLQSGYAADFILGMTVESLNGVRNRSTAAGMVGGADPEFLRAIALLREVQATGAVGMRVEEDKVKGSTAVLFFRREDMPADVVEKVAEIRRLLKMPVGPQRFTLRYSPARGADDELTVNSRSMLQIMQAFPAISTSRGSTSQTIARCQPLHSLQRRCSRASYGFTAARKGRRTRMRPYVTVTTGSGLTRATCGPNARSTP